MIGQLPIRWRLTLWYMSLTTFVLVIFSIAVYVALERQLSENLDEDLRNQLWNPEVEEEVRKARETLQRRNRPPGPRQAQEGDGGGIDSLRRSTRAAWLAANRHRLPSGARYYSVVAVPGVQIRAADADGLDLRRHLAIGRGGHRPVERPHLVRPGLDQGFHALSPAFDAVSRLAERIRSTMQSMSPSTGPRPQDD